VRWLAESMWHVMRKFGFGPLLLRVHPKSGLLRRGWFQSFRQKRPIDRTGEPIPWWTYSFTAFIEERLTSSMRVLEFGSGNSTVWLSTRVKEVVSLESDPDWAVSVAKRLPANARVLLRSSLLDAAATLDAKLSDFDILVIDAGNRIEIAKLAVGRLNQQGVVIWDNTDGPDWPAIRGLLVGYGFREVSFSGLIPQEVCESRTTVFYRTHNCLCL